MKSPIIQLLNHRNFASLWWGGLISLIGNRMLSVTLPFYVYQKTNSTVATATMVLATIIPSMLFSSIAGVFVDRWNRKRILVLSNFLLALSLLPLLVVSITDWIFLIYLVAFFESTLSTFFRTAENAVLPQLVSKEQLVPANALNALNDTLARLIGPAVGGILFASGNLEIIVILDCVSYGVAGLLVLMVKVRDQKIRSPKDTAVTERWWQSLRQGIMVILCSRVLKRMLVVLGITTFGGTMIDPLFAPFVFDILLGNATHLGWILTLQGLGGLLGGLLIGQFAKAIKPAILFGLSSVVIGILLFGMFQNVSVEFVMLLSFLLGLVLPGSRVGIQTLMQMNTSDENRGRVYGIYAMVGSGLELLSVIFAGVAAEQLGVVLVLSLAAAVTFSAGVLALVLIAPKTN